MTGQLWTQVLYSLPRPVQSTTSALKQLQLAVLQSQSLRKHTGRATVPEDDMHTEASMEYGSSDADMCSAVLCVAEHDCPTATSLLVNFMLLLGHMAKNYELEKADFLRQLKASRAPEVNKGMCNIICIPADVHHHEPCSGGFIMRCFRLPAVCASLAQWDTWTLCQRLV